MNSPKISVIIPVYNSERFLQECIESAQNQTYSNLEVILVDDGSKDQSPEICDRMSQKDNRIRVIHKENEGVSKARNTALQYATGDYICFMDSDDRLDRNIFEQCLPYMQQDIDSIVYGYVRFSYGDDDYRHVGRSGTYETEEDILEAILKIKKTNNYVPLWNKLYRHSVIKENNISFDNQTTILEDQLFNNYFFHHIKSLCLLNQIGYQYRLFSSDNCLSKRKFDGEFMLSVSERLLSTGFWRSRNKDLSVFESTSYLFEITKIIENVFQSKDIPNKQSIKYIDILIHKFSRQKYAHFIQELGPVRSKVFSLRSCIFIYLYFTILSKLK